MRFVHAQPSTGRDSAIVARSVVEQVIGEQLDGRPLPAPSTQKDQKAVARGRLGGAKGGAARAQVLSAEQRANIARRAAAKRWEKKS